MEQQLVREEEQQEAAAVRAALEAGRPDEAAYHKQVRKAMLDRIDNMDERLKVLEKQLARQERSEQGVARYCMRKQLTCSMDFQLMNAMPSCVFALAAAVSAAAAPRANHFAIGESAAMWGSNACLQVLAVSPAVACMLANPDVVCACAACMLGDAFNSLVARVTAVFVTSRQKVE